MKTRIPLYAKILLFFLLNLVFLGAVFYLFFQYQFRAGFDSLLMAQAGERVQAVSRVVAAELNETPRTNWNNLLARFSEAYDTRFFLYRNDGAQLGGDPVTLPPEVLQKVKEQRGMGMGMGRRGPPAGRGPNRFMDPIDTGSPGRGINRQATALNPESMSKFLLHSRNPSGYWIGVCLPQLSGSPAGLPIMLLAMSPTLRGGLFPNLIPGLWVGLVAVLCSALFWLPLVHGITRCIGQMTKATEQIAEGRFDTQVKTNRRDELGRLGQAINRMSARLFGLVNGQKRFMGDVAHELCSPIARMQVALGILEEQAAEKQKTCVADAREDLQQMSNLIDELLSFSKAALRQQPVALKAVRLAGLVHQVVEREQANPETVRVDIEASLEILAEPELLSRALGNLVRNAIRYAGSSGPIRISATRASKDTVSISVIDSGPGVPEPSLEQIFDPFYRVESSRSRETGGVGLGLAIVKTCIEACQGTVVAKNRQPSGLEVVITLKAVGGGN